MHDSMLVVGGRRVRRRHVLFLKSGCFEEAGRASQRVGTIGQKTVGAAASTVPAKNLLDTKFLRWMHGRRTADSIH